MLGFLRLKLILIFLIASFQILYAKDLKIIYAGYMRDITKIENGSYSNLATLLNHYRKNNDVLFLFGGNSIGPSIISNMDKGVHIVEILNTLELDVYGVSDSEFSYSVEEFSLCTDSANFPFVASNVFYENGDFIDGTVQRLIVQKADIKIGVMSMLGDKAIERYGLKNIRIEELKNSIEKNTNILRKQGADIIILLKREYMSIPDDVLKNNTVDLIFSKNPYLKIQTTDEYKNNIFLKKHNEVAVVSVKRKDDNFSFSIKKESLLDYKPDEKINKIIATYEKSINAFLSEKIGLTKVELNTKRLEVRTKENLFGNLVADAIKDYAKAEISLINGGMIRGNKIYAKNSEITRKDIIEELPFSSKIVLLKIKGQRILEALENALSLLEEEDGRFLHVSGIKVIYDTSLDSGKRLKKVLFNGKELQKDKIYRLAISDFYYRGGDAYHMFRDSKQIKEYRLARRFIYDIVINYISKKKIIDIKFENRLKDLTQG